MKSKYLYLIGWESGIIEKVGQGLTSIKIQLEREVLCDGWREGILSPSKSQNEGDGQNLDLEDLKYEKVAELKPKTEPTKDGFEIKSKVEYLKSFRDIFG